MIQNSNRTNIMKTILSVVTLLAGFSLGHFANAQGTMFTYQGRLNDGANAASGIYGKGSVLNGA